MFDIGPEKLLVILAIALVFLGPKKLPEMARSIGKGVREFRNASAGIREELTAQLDAPDAPPASSPDTPASSSESPNGTSGGGST